MLSTMDEWTIKKPNPIRRLFLSVDLLSNFAAFCLTAFIDWRYIHSWFVFSTQLVNCCPHGRRNYTCVYWCHSTVPSLWPPSPLPPFPNYMYSIYRQCVWGGGGGELCCRPYSAGILHSVSDQIQNLPNCYTTLNKMTSEDDIKGLVSLKFLRPCSQP